MKRIVVLSDLHLGDPASALECDPWSKPVLTWLRQGLSELAIEKVDYLVLAGDVLDFSVSSFKRSYSVARAFFTALRDSQLAEEIIYIPGNHDKDVWDSVEKEVCVFRKLRKGKDPVDLPYEQPGIIDISGDGDARLNLPGVNYARGRKRKKQYGALFLEGLFSGDRPLPISVVYPNLYVLLPEGRWILVTHGHLFELAWAFITEVFGKLLTWTTDDPPKEGLKWLEQCNIPGNTLICTGLGQGGPTSRLIRGIQAEVKEGKVNEISKTLATFLKWLDERLKYSFPLEQLQDLLFGTIRKLAVKELKKFRPSRGSETFLKDKKNLIEKFLEATRLTVASLKPDTVPGHLREYPDCLIFGHTHVPLFAESPQLVDFGGSPDTTRRINFLNTGSCLRGETAGMISIDEKGGCSSSRVEFPAAKD